MGYFYFNSDNYEKGLKLIETACDELVFENCQFSEGEGLRCEILDNLNGLRRSLCKVEELNKHGKLKK